MIFLHRQPRSGPRRVYSLRKSDLIDLHAAEMRALSTSLRKRKSALANWAQRRAV
jgi:hypothetical protein